MELELGNIVSDLLRWVEAYLAEIRNKNLADRTLEVYGAILNDFVEYSRQYQGEAGIVDINRIFLNAYLTNKEKIAKSFSASSRSLYVTVLKKFFRYITENNDSNADFEKMFKDLIIKREQKIKPSLTESDILRLLAYLDKSKAKVRNRLISYRNSLLIKIMLYSGLRASELLPFRLSDLVYDAELKVYALLILGKGKKQRYSYLPAEMVEDEVEVLTVAYGPEWLICSVHDGGIINRANLWQIVSGIFKRAGVDQTGLHILRHTFARRLVSKNINLETIRDLLGHSDISTTARFYAKSDETNKRLAVSSVLRATLKPEKDE